MKLFGIRQAGPTLLSIPCYATARRRAPAIMVRAQSQKFPEAFNQKAREAQDKLKQWAEEQKLQQKLGQAAKEVTSKAQQAAERVQDGATRTAAQIDREYEVSKKAQQVAERVKEAADEVDTKYGVRQRARHTWEDAKRKWPTWRRQLAEFLNTPLGTLAAAALLAIALYTGLVLHVFKWLTFILFLGPLLAGPYLRQKVMEQEAARQAAAQQAAEQERRRQQQQQFYDIFGRFQGRRQQSQRQGGGRAAGGPKGGRGWNSGQVIDVEHETIDD